MRIRIRDISPSGLKISDSISLESLNNRMAEGKSSDIVFISAPQAELLVTKTMSGAQVQGKVYANYTQCCGACPEIVGRLASADIGIIFQERPLQDSGDDGVEYEDDIGLVYFEGDHIELEELLQEALILTLDPYWRPDCDNNGVCSYCKKIPAKELALAPEGKVSLGTLLQKAGVK